MNKFTFALYSLFIASLLAAGCAAPSFLMNPTEPPHPSPEEQIQQTTESLESWTGQPISKVIREWGSPHGITNDDEGSTIYIYQTQMFVQTHSQGQEHRVFSHRHPSDMQDGTEAYLPTDHFYEFMFYTDTDGVIYKTFVQRDENPSVGSQSLSVSYERPRTTR